MSDPSWDSNTATASTGDVENVAKTCHFCGLPIPDGERPIGAKTGNAYAHFECWYDGAPFPRDEQTGALL
jgi:hypothetical protein